MPDNFAQTRPSLLISVRSLEEFSRVRAFPIDYLDLKAPERGPLAAVSPHLWKAVAKKHQSGGLGPRLSAALGEFEEAKSNVAQLPDAFGWMKMGPSQHASTRALRSSWRLLSDFASPTTELVAVAYADAHRAKSPPVDEILRAAADTGLRYALIDTFDKSGSGTIQLLGWSRLTQLARLATELKLHLTIAGSLKLSDALRCLRSEIPVHGFGIRGDVCTGSRTASVCPDRLQAWVRRLGRNSSSS